MGASRCRPRCAWHTGAACRGCAVVKKCTEWTGRGGSSGRLSRASCRCPHLRGLLRGLMGDGEVLPLLLSLKSFRCSSSGLTVSLPWPLAAHPRASSSAQCNELPLPKN